MQLACGKALPGICIDPSRKRRAQDDNRLLSLMQRPAGITVISALFSLAAIYLCTIGVVKLLAPDAISLMSGAQLMYGLELAGPYMATARRSCICAGWLGIIPDAQLGALGCDVGAGDCRRGARPEDLDGGVGRSRFLVWTPNCLARRSRVAFGAGARSRRRVRRQTLTNLATDLHGLPRIKILSSYI